MKKMYIDVVHIYMFFFFFKSDEWLESYDLKCINMYHLDGGVYIGKLFGVFPTFLNHFTPIWLKITHNCKFCQKSWLDWVKTAKFGYFAWFSIFSPKMKPRLTRNFNFTQFTTFPIFCHQSISFLEKSQKFSFLGGGGRVHQQIFWVFQLFQIISHQCGWKWPTIANLAKKVA